MNPQLPPLVYTFEAKSETIANPWALGLVGAIIADSYKKAHESFLAALNSEVGTDGAPTPLRHLECIGVTEPATGCRRMVKYSNPPTDDELATLLRNEPTHSALLTNISVIFDGRFFQTVTATYELQLDENDKVARRRHVGVTYISTYSKSRHRADIDERRNDEPFIGKVGTKEARAHYWLGGSKPRLPDELDDSFKRIADVYAAALAPDATGYFAGDASAKATMPRLKDVVAGEPSKCAILHGKYPVIKQEDGYVWLAITDFKFVMVFVEPRCGFDY